MSDHPTGKAVSTVRAMLTPSLASVQAAYASLSELAEQIQADSGQLMETLGGVADMLDTVRGSTDLRDSLGGLGLLEDLDRVTRMRAELAAAS